MMDDTRVLLDDGDEIPLVPVRRAGSTSVSAAASSVVSSPALPAVSALKAVPVMDQLLAETKEEKREIAAIVAATPGGASFSTSVTAPITLDSAVDEAIAAAAVPLANDDMRRRFRMLVSLFFRDLRDDLETKSKFTMPAASGGMGFAESDAVKIMDVFIINRKAYLSGEALRAAEAKATYVAARSEVHLTDADAREKTESAARDITHGKLMEASGLALPGSMVPPPAPTSPKVIPVIAASPSRIVEVIVPPAPASVPAPVPVPSPVPPQPPAPELRFEPPANLPVETVAVPEPPLLPPASVLYPASVSVPLPSAPAPVVTPKPVPPPTPAFIPTSARPTMSDVQVAPRLTGPVDELRALTLVDFRKLSKEPREATLKIMDKVDLLNDVSFEEKSRGVKAWTESPLNKAYLDILRRSLEGRPVMDVIADMSVKGESTLNKAEFDSLMELNRKLRFG